MAKICLVVLIGLPAAGKTNFCNELVQKLSPNKDYHCHNIAYDNIIDKPIKINKGSFQKQYKEFRKRAFVFVEDKIKSLISSREDFKRQIMIIDDNMYYKSMRYEYYKLARQYKTSFLQIYINVSLNTILARNSKREEEFQVPESIIHDMSKKLEPPGNEHWELNLLTLVSDSALNDTTLGIVFDAIEKYMELPILPQEENKTGTLPATKLQCIDLLLRKIVHEKINEDNTQSEMYNRKKREIFQKIKDNENVIDPQWSDVETINYLEKLF